MIRFLLYSPGETIDLPNGGHPKTRYMEEFSAIARLICLRPL
jgi:hypothetical protein